MKNNLFYAFIPFYGRRIENQDIDFESHFSDSFYQYFVFLLFSKSFFYKKTSQKHVLY